MEREWVLLNPGLANTTARVRRALVGPDLCHREPEFFSVMRECRERLVRLAAAGAPFTAVLFTGQGDIRRYAFRVANMGTLTPRDMAEVVTAFAAVLDELGVAPAGALDSRATTVVPPPGGRGGAGGGGGRS